MLPPGYTAALFKRAVNKQEPRTKHMLDMNAQSQSPVRGDLLSCYTSSIAEYMQQAGIDYQLVMGTQLFLAVNVQSEHPARLSFVHYHTPLLGNFTTHSLHLVRKGTADQAEAMHSIARQCELFGAVIVAGDAINFPWSVTYGKKHAPHWFIITAIDEQHAYITDRFEFLNEHGMQQPFTGKINREQLATILQAHLVQEHTYQAREQWAFGLEMPTNDQVLQQYQWFESTSRPQSHAADERGIRLLLKNTYAFHSGQQRRIDLSKAGWTYGLQALHSLAHHFETHLDHAAMYQYSDDIWVVARNRQMFAHVLDRLGKTLQVTDLNGLAAWCEAELIEQWNAIPRIMRYNAGCLERGRKPSMLLVESFLTAARLEEILLERLHHIL